MGKLSFRNGMQMNDEKESSKKKEILTVLPKDEMVYPLLQHIGLPARPVVEVGETVLAGQRIAEANGVVSAHIISGVSGRVKAIEERMTAAGAVCEAIVIENDGEFRTAEGYGEKRDYTKLSKAEIREYIKEAGIVGLGGVGFPTHVKLSPKNEDKIEYVIVNGAESEPYLTADECLMTEEPEKIVDGLKILLWLFDNAKGVILIEKKKKAAVKRLSALVKSEPKIVVKAVDGRYPLGAERQVIKTVTGRKMNSSMLPTDVGCVVNNAGTVHAVYMAVAESTPLIKRVVTVAGDGVANPQNVWAYIGMSCAELAEAAGGCLGEPELFVSGGPLMGNALEQLAVPVGKTSSALLIMKKNEAERLPVSPCIRCGRCMDVCPSCLTPYRLLKCAEQEDRDGFVRLDGMECCECGACSYVCPAGKPLAQMLRQTRRSVLDERRRR